MNKWSAFFNFAIRVMLIFAFGAFLWASLHHIAFFFAAFEPAGTDLAGSYALAIALDGTALLLTIYMMFFSGNMPRHSWAIVWGFIIGLTGLSWLINFEYATHFQSAGLTTNPFLQMLNPFIASSFALLNLVYSVISENLSFKVKSAEELGRIADEMEAKLSVEQRINALKSAQRKAAISSWIDTAKSALSEMKAPTISDEAPAEQEDISPEDEVKRDTDCEPVVTPNESESAPELEAATRVAPSSNDVSEQASQARRGKYYMTYEEASAYTGYAVIYLKSQVTSGKIETAPDGKKLKVSTLKIKGQTSAKLPALQLVREA